MKFKMFPNSSQRIFVPEDFFFPHWQANEYPVINGILKLSPETSFYFELNVILVSLISGMTILCGQLFFKSNRIARKKRQGQCAYQVASSYQKQTNGSEWFNSVSAILRLLRKSNSVTHGGRQESQASSSPCFQITPVISFFALSSEDAYAPNLAIAGAWIYITIRWEKESQDEFCSTHFCLVPMDRNLCLFLAWKMIIRVDQYDKKALL